MKKLYIIALHIIALFLCSCSGSWHMSRAIKKDPSLFNNRTEVQADTITNRSVRVDTTFLQVRDTLIQYIQKDNLGRDIEIRYKWNTLTDTVEVSVDCPDQEVITNTITHTNTVLIKPTIWQSVKSLWWVFLLIVSFITTIKLLR